MGEMAEIALDDCAAFEAEHDAFMTGNMSIHDAFEKGIIDHDGCIVDMQQFEMSINRNSIKTLENLNNELSHAEKDFELAMSRSERDAKHQLREVLSEEAIANIAKPNPTCNICSEQMRERMGKFGKFYFCECPDQCTVSDEYWQSLKSNYQGGDNND